MDVVMCAERGVQLSRQLLRLDQPRLIPGFEQADRSNIESILERFSQRSNLSRLRRKRQQSNQPSRTLRDLLPGDPRFPFGVRQAALRKQLAQIRVAHRILNMD